MSWLTWILFESQIALAAVVGVVLFVLLAWWRRGGRAQPFLIGVAVCAALFVTQVLVVTHHERADRTLTGIEDDLLESRIDALAEALAPGFRTDPDNGEELPRDVFIAQVEALMEHIDIRWIERWRLDVVQSQSDGFTVEATYRCDLVYRNTQASPRSNWTFTFTRTPAGWKIDSLRMDRIDGVRDPTWSRVRGTR